MPQIGPHAEISACPRTNLANVASQPATEPCEYCHVAVRNRVGAKRTLFPQVWTEYERFDHYPDFPALHVTAKSGCGLCWLILEAIRKASPLKAAENWTGTVKLHNFTYHKKGPGSEDNLFMELAFSPDTSGKAVVSKLGKPTFNDVESAKESWTQKVYFGVYETLAMSSTLAFRSSRAKLAACENVLLPSPHTLSPANIGMIREWLQECENEHEVCGRYTGRIPQETDLEGLGGPGLANEVGWLPTRLLTVGKTGDQSIRLLEAYTLQSGIPTVKYAALSHMWGNVAKMKPLRTMKDNYTQMLTAIDLHELPLTFADAITVCRALQIEYIWIDSLCIVQDDGNDWATEAKMMDKVYKLAYVTIVSASATSSADGFLARDLETIPAAKISLQGETGSTPGYFVMTTRETPEDEFGKAHVEGSTWNTRGWTMQERYLSTRLIYFCHNKIYLECLSDVRSEYHRHSDNRDHDWGRENRPAKADGFELAITKIIFRDNKPVMVKTSGTPGVFELEDSQESVRAAKGHEKTMLVEFPAWMNHWLQLVEAYSARKLTFQTDKLVAIQGVAARLAPHLYVSYLAWAGLWSHGYLPQQLLWSVHQGDKSRRLNIGSPTWSWAGLQGKIHFDFEYYQVEHPGFNNYKPKISIIEPDSICIKTVTREAKLGMLALANPRARLTDHPYFRLWDANAPVVTAAFAHVLLDVVEAEDYHNTWTRVIYVHLWTDPSTSGLVIETVAGEDGIAHWRRIGTATIFDPSTNYSDEPKILQPGGSSNYEVREFIIR